MTIKNLSLPLSERLIQAGMEILLSGEPLTLRGAAARAGVSHGAPAHHFDGLSGLQTAIATKAFRDFGKLLRDALNQPVAADHPEPARERLRNLGRAYCHFAQHQGALFDLMFLKTDVDHDNADLVSAMGYAYEPLRTATAPFIKGRDRNMIETVIWCVAHGYAVLGCAERVNGLPPPFGAPSLDDLMQAMSVMDILQPAEPAATDQTS